MAGGRPSKYSEEMLVLASAYIEQYQEMGDMVPSIQGLAKQLKVSEKTLYNWSDEDADPEFLQTLEILKSEQARTLINNGLSGEFNPTITKLMLHNHGYSDKAEVDNKGEIKVIGLNKDFGDA